MVEKRREHPKRRSQHPGFPDFRGKKFILASQINVKRLQPYIDRILELLGFSDALVTDKTYVTDFLFWKDPKEIKEQQLQALAEQLGVAVGWDDYLYEVADRLRVKEEANG